MRCAAMIVTVALAHANAMNWRRKKLWRSCLLRRSGRSGNDLGGGVHIYSRKILLGASKWKWHNNESWRHGTIYTRFGKIMW